MLEALILGLVEGLTEFLPISSTGHLLIAEHWLGARSDLFNVAIQVGAIAAVTLVYRERIVGLLLRWREPAERDYLRKLAAAFLVTAVLGAAASYAGAELPQTVTPIAVALIVGGLLIFLAEYYAKRHAAAQDVTWRVVLAVGVAQVIAGVFPGTSRSAAAIFAAMFAGLTARPSAAEFAFLVGIPTMLAASGFELVRASADGGFDGEAWGELGVAFVIAAVAGFASVKWLLAYISRHTFVGFAWYRIALGVVLLAVL
ncbi:MAG TPA: undecaprenyl-diphosphate phosphatase [Gammaproteobacteria bacterium]|nr:undecaprenyl-diphosphate phosphatase [Gammaproteobacteria bacterium]